MYIEGREHLVIYLGVAQRLSPLTPGYKAATLQDSLRIWDIAENEYEYLKI